MKKNNSTKIDGSLVYKLKDSTLSEGKKLIILEFVNKILNKYLNVVSKYNHRIFIYLIKLFC